MTNKHEIPTEEGKEDIPKNQKEDNDQNEVPETFIDDEDKAWEIAKAENPFRTLAFNAKENGMGEMAEEYEKKADEAGEKRCEEYKEKLKQINEEVKEIMAWFMEKIEEMHSTEKNLNLKLSDHSFSKESILKAEKLMGVDKFAYKDDWHMTDFDRVIYNSETKKVFFYSERSWLEHGRESLEEAEKAKKEREEKEKEQELEEKE